MKGRKRARSFVAAGGGIFCFAIAVQSLAGICDPAASAEWIATRASLPRQAADFRRRGLWHIGC